VEYETSYLGMRRGVCSSWLAELPSAGPEALPVWLFPGSLRLPADPSVPLIMVGPGTGCAPFRAILQARRAQRQRTPVGESLLFVGFRNRAADFLYGADFEQFAADGTLSALHVAFSRDTESKVYVQHKMRTAGREICGLLGASAFVLVAGSSGAMPRAVRSALVEAVRECGALEIPAFAVGEAGVSAEQAEAFVKKMELSGRLQMEVY